MIPLLEELFKEIEHGDQEHRDWLYNKMEEFSNKKLNMSEVQREPTFGEKAAGVSFNPSKNPNVDEVKALYAKVIDKLNELRADAGRGEAARYYSKAISYTEDAQMNAVKAITWAY